ncbi:hypothetical protein [Hydrogenophaga sp. 5NK40-0174]|uniref:hypothetical protein n=1 Tax=Hydrogenophaga sp. 5NK40-0174 TaxID=3127649 RepID=UPI00310AA7BD
MSMFNWLQTKPDSGGKKKKKGGLRNAFRETTLPLISPRRGRRLLRREQLFSVVRESLIRGGVLSTSYEFKVLALDSNGDSFLVLVDLALPAQTMPDEYLLEIERWIQIAAQSRHSMKVRSVYWRRKLEEDQQGVALRAAIAAQQRRGSASDEKSENPTAIPVPPKSKPRQAAEPVRTDEVQAFRKALDGGQPLPDRMNPKQGQPGRLPPQEEHEPESVSAFDELSETQYGKLE